jgi:hypothetical protein
MIATWCTLFDVMTAQTIGPELAMRTWEMLLSSTTEDELLTADSATVEEC